MAVKNTVQAVPITVIASSALTGTFAPINPGGLPNSCFLVKFISTSTTFVSVSLDGVNTHIVIPPGPIITDVNAQTNGQPNSITSQFAKGTVFYAMGTAGTGALWISGWYNPVGGNV